MVPTHQEVDHIMGAVQIQGVPSCRGAVQIFRSESKFDLLFYNTAFLKAWI